MSKFHTLRIKSVDRETKDSVAIQFEVPESLRKEYKYNHGQHMTLKAIINGEEVSRSYSLCSCPLENTWRVAIKKVPGGKFSTFANTKLKPGDELEVMTPMGHFYTELDPGQAKKYIAFVAGSGITPILSIIKTTLLVEPDSEFMLFYGNRTSKDIIFKEELEGLKNRFLNRFSIYHILSREQQESDLFNGRIDEEKIRAYAKYFFSPDSTDEYFICGPEPMIKAAQETLLDLGVAKKSIHYELFTSPVGSLIPKTERKKEEYDPSVSSRVTVKSDGKSFQFTLPYGGKSILDAAMEHGADLPFSCKGGVCPGRR